MAALSDAVDSLAELGVEDRVLAELAVGHRAERDPVLMQDDTHVRPGRAAEASIEHHVRGDAFQQVLGDRVPDPGQDGVEDHGFERIRDAETRLTQLGQ